MSIKVDMRVAILLRLRSFFCRTSQPLTGLAVMLKLITRKKVESRRLKSSRIDYLKKMVYGLGRKPFFIWANTRARVGAGGVRI